MAPSSFHAIWWNRLLPELLPAKPHQPDQPATEQKQRGGFGDTGCGYNPNPVAGFGDKHTYSQLVASNEGVGGPTFHTPGRIRCGRSASNLGL